LFAAPGRATACGTSLRQGRRFDFIACLGSRLDAHDRHALFAESRNDLELTAESFDVPSQRADLAVTKVGASFEARHIALVHLRFSRDVHLRLADGLADCS
jgi:hypothetical protein